MMQINSNVFKILMQWASMILKKTFIKLLVNSEMNQLCAPTHPLREQQPPCSHQKGKAAQKSHHSPHLPNRH